MALIETRDLIEQLKKQAAKYKKLNTNNKNTFTHIYFGSIETALNEIITSLLEIELAECNPNPTDWSNAPDWANWKATDENYEVWWFAYKPYPIFSGWTNNIGKCQVAGKEVTANWKSSLQQRPR